MEKTQKIKNPVDMLKSKCYNTLCIEVLICLICVSDLFGHILPLKYVVNGVIMAESDGFGSMDESSDE